uniref:Uncharacterized protein n=1 Tax=Lepeophtheirus salmonis TaxID=72036 RepID=A0A0K2URJ6_LEPSM
MHIKHRVHLFSERNCNVCLVPIIIEKVDSQKQVDVERRIIRTFITLKFLRATFLTGPGCNNWI